MIAELDAAMGSVRMRSWVSGASRSPSGMDCCVLSDGTPTPRNNSTRSITKDALAEQGSGRRQWEYEKERRAAELAELRDKVDEERRAAEKELGNSRRAWQKFL